MKLYQKGIPFAFAKTVFDIDYDKLEKQGYTTLFFDLDNTIIPYQIKVVTGEEKAFLEALNQRFKMVIVSNNRKKRVAKALEEMNIPFVSKAFKPFKRGYKKALKMTGSNPKEVIFIGDQIMTDIYGANRMGMNAILVLPIEKRKTTFTTRINRRIERYFIKRIYKYEPEIYKERIKAYVEHS